MYLNYSQAAALLGVPKGTLYSLVHQHRIPHIRLGARFVRFDEDRLRAWMGQHRVEPHRGQEGGG